MTHSRRTVVLTVLVLTFLISQISKAGPADNAEKLTLLREVAEPFSAFVQNAQVTTSFRVLSSDPGLLQGVEVISDDEARRLVLQIRSSFGNEGGERLRSSLVSGKSRFQLQRSSIDGVNRIAALEKETEEQFAQPYVSAWSNARGHAFQFPGDFDQSRLAVVCEDKSLDLIDLVFGMASRRLDARFRELLEGKNLERYRASGFVEPFAVDYRYRIPHCDVTGFPYQVFRYVNRETNSTASSPFTATTDSFSTINIFDGEQLTIMSWVWADLRSVGKGTPKVPLFGALLLYRVSPELQFSGKEFSFLDGTSFSIYLISNEVTQMDSDASAESILPIAGQEFEHANMACGADSGDFQVDPKDFGKSIADFSGNPFSYDSLPPLELGVRPTATHSTPPTVTAPGFGLKGQAFLVVFGIACILLGWVLRGKRS